jgi:alkyl sulfatase BDS1-like metallo-beta-lactamase superfamily hydrolase
MGEPAGSEGAESAVVDFSKSVGRCSEVTSGVHLLPGFGNTTFVLGDDGVAVIDPGLFTNGPRVVRELRRLTDLPVRYVIYTHGHFDHAFGTPALLEEAESRGEPAPEIVGHVNVARRFDRYAKTQGHLAQTFDLQFAGWMPNGGDVIRKAVYCKPTLEYDDRLLLDGLGGRSIECRHGLGETDDHTWVWIPDVRTIVGGDFIVSSMPNAGTPFRVQRYVVEWAEALDEMAALEPAAVISGHGGVFTDNAAEMLAVTSRALRFLEDEVVGRLNDGQWYEQIVQEVCLPDDLEASQHLQPLYGCTSFVVHSVLRRYTGWYDGNPTHLFPSPSAAVAAEVLALVGGPAPVLARADELAALGRDEDVQLALHLVDFVIGGAAGDVDVARRRKADFLDQRAAGERSFVAHNVLRSAATIERERLNG